MKEKMYYGEDQPEEPFVPAPCGDARADFERRSKEIVEKVDPVETVEEAMDFDESLKAMWEVHKSFGPLPK